MKILEFLQSSSGENSSKRLAFLSGHLFITLTTLILGDRLIDHKQYDYAVTVYNSYLIYCTVLGGFVTAEILIKVLQIIKGKKN